MSVYAIKFSPLKILSIVVFIGGALLFFSAAKAEQDGPKNTAQANGFSQTINDPRYQKLPTYLIHIKDKALEPAELIVPSHTRFRLVIKNIGSKPAEFESHQLHQEKIIFMKKDVTVVIKPLDIGTYNYFNDFDPGVNGKVIVKDK